MPYTPSATDTSQPADTGVLASTAAAEFRTLKTYLAAQLASIASSLGLKAPLAGPTFTGTVTVSGGKIAFPAVQSPSADANVLDDYEEGTFTVTAENAGNPILLTVDTGCYVKIGKVVHFWINAAWASTSGDGTIQLNGLPFTSQAGFLHVVDSIPNNLSAYVGASSNSVITLLNTTGGAQVLYIAGSYPAVN